SFDKAGGLLPLFRGFHDRLHRNQDSGLLQLVDQDADLGTVARLEAFDGLVFIYGDDRLIDLDVGGHPVLFGINIVHRFNVAVEHAVRVGVQADLGGLAGTNAGKEGFVDPDGDLEYGPLDVLRIQVRDADHFLAFPDRFSLGDDRLLTADAPAGL